MTEITGYWFFSCQPSIWQIDLFLKTNPEYGTYTVAQNHQNKIKPGHLGVIRVSIDNRSQKFLDGRKKLESGVYAIVEILSSPTIGILQADDAAHLVDQTDAGKEGLRVRIRYLKNLINKPLLINHLKENGIINQDKLFINGRQSPTWVLKKETFEELVEMLDSRDQIFSNIEVEKIDTVEQIAKLELKYQNALPEVKEVISNRIERGKISSLVKKLNGYRCKVCEALGRTPHTFKKINGEYYIETHHIIPVADLIKGSLGFSNLITVCANHHREFHYGEIEIVNSSRNQLILKINGQNLQIEKTVFT